MLYRSFMAGRGSSRQGRSRPKKNGLSPYTHAPPTALTTPLPPLPLPPPHGHPLHSREFVMILNSRYVELGSQPSFPPHPSPPLPLPPGHETRTSPSAPSSTPSFTLSQPMFPGCIGLIIHPIIGLQEPACGAQI